MATPSFPPIPNDPIGENHAWREWFSRIHNLTLPIIAGAGSGYATLAQLAAPSGSSLIGFLQAGTGAISRTSQEKLREVKSVADYGTFTQYKNAAFSSFFYSDNGAVIVRITDRLFVGGAANNDGTTTQTANDWLSIYQNLKSRPGGPALHYTTLGVLNQNTLSPNVFSSGAQTTGMGVGVDAIAISGFGLNNTASNTNGAFGLYVEAYRDVGAGGQAYGAEMDVANFSSLAQNDPYVQNSGQTITLQLAAGAQLGSVGTFPITSAINIQNNTQTFDKGIIFGSTSISGANGSSGTGTAIALGLGHVIQWYSAASSPSAAIYSTVSTPTGGISQQFQNNAVYFFSSINGNGVFQILCPTAPVNHIAVSAANTGNPTAINAFGTDTNIDISIIPQGSGVVSFGTYTASPGIVQAGYITIKDSGGTVRRLLVG